jgi:hypothetical protein
MCSDKEAKDSVKDWSKGLAAQISNDTKTKNYTLWPFIPQANHTDRATAPCW